MSFSRTALPPATVLELPAEVLCTDAAAAIASAEPEAAATRAICIAASAAASLPPLLVVTSSSRIWSTVENWLTVRTR